MPPIRDEDGEIIEFTDEGFAKMKPVWEANPELWELWLNSPERARIEALRSDSSAAE